MKLLVFCLLVIIPFQLMSQEAHKSFKVRPNIVIPQFHVFDQDRQGAVKIIKVDVNFRIKNNIAVTNIMIDLYNPLSRILESELLIPIPKNVVIKGFDFLGQRTKPSLKIMPSDQAKAYYKSIVATLRDPALLEFAGMNLIRSSVFPVPARGHQKIKVTYEQLLKADSNRYDYIIPRSESLTVRVPWTIKGEIINSNEIISVYSPSHKIESKKISAGHSRINLGSKTILEPGAFSLSYMLRKGDIGASLFTYPSRDSKGGYFLFLGGLPEIKPEDKKNLIKKEICLVIDRSGSMRGQKMEQAKEAALQIIGALKTGEYFNIITYNSAVEQFSNNAIKKNKKSFKKAEEYLNNINSSGGTNIFDALKMALKQSPNKGTLPIILFLTDGLPTMGETRETKIRELTSKENPFHKRVFTFGVGHDVNAPLLDKIAEVTKAVSTFVLPSENIEVKIGSVFEKLNGPLFLSPKLEVLDENGNSGNHLVSDLLPHQLSDVYNGDQILVFGRYIDDIKKLHFRLSGDLFQKKIAMKFSFNVGPLKKENAFVPRLWASRQIASMVDAIRYMGADNKSIDRNDPKFKELISEIIRLSKKFGILTEYTSFFVREGSDLNKKTEMAKELVDNLERDAIRKRSGLHSIVQSKNATVTRKQKSMNRFNGYLGKDLKEKKITKLYQCNDSTFYKKGDIWVDGKVALKENNFKNLKKIILGSNQYWEIVDELIKKKQISSLSVKGKLVLRWKNEDVLIINQ
ncbi:MAG: hypothetical protein COA79_02780 [Planctomycetota bacterium]|nr:MAG: hypothetical protein COA79_02780 [Planctomycetota bacterium]